MKYLFTYKANDWSKTDKLEALTITFNQALPEYLIGQGGFEGYMRDTYLEKGKEFVDALCQHAPGGLVDAIFAELARRKASVFSVAHERLHP